MIYHTKLKYYRTEKENPVWCLRIARYLGTVRTLFFLNFFQLAKSSFKTT